MIALAALCAGLLVMPVSAGSIVTGQVSRRVNKVRARPPYEVSPAARALHGRLRVADMHADPLLWGRDLLRRNGHGHVDVPRLIDGGVALQVFSIVTQAPMGINIKSNDANRGDLITSLAVASGWPRKTWTSKLERARHQAGSFEAAAERSGGRLVAIRTREDLQEYLAARGTGTVAGLLSVEGAQALEGKLENVEALYVMGVRMVGLTHFVDNEAGGSAHGTSGGGLSEFGRQVLAALEERLMIVDLAHASPALIDDVLKHGKTPPVVSHTGVRGTCPNERNLTDDQLKRIGAKGGLISIGFWRIATCGDDADAAARAIVHAAKVAGASRVALGSDFDGAVAQPFDASGLPLLTEALLEQGMPEKDIALVMGGNVLRFLSERLPER
ncbi:MAG: membrane dipeptidase [Elusimicrobia bacterium]|nr:membrane dipeptidase [Elusimicrobiota bacterium]